MLKSSILGIILLSFLTSCSLETKTEDSNRYEIVDTSSFPILLDKQTGESWTAWGSNNGSKAVITWNKNTKN